MVAAHPSSPEFLNVDLELESRRKLDPLIEAFGGRVMVLHKDLRRGYHYAIFEVSAQSRGPNATIRAFVKLVERLPAEARALWNAARRRDFDIGIDIGKGRHVPVVALSPDTVRSASGVGASILVTCYPPLRATPRRPIPLFRIE